MRINFGNRRRTLVIVVAVLCLSVSGGLLLNSQSIQIQPFTISYSRTNFDSSGQVESAFQHALAIRSDGSQATFRMQLFPDGQEYEKRNIIDFTNGLRIGIDAATGSRTTTAFRAQASYQRARVGCRDAEGDRINIMGFEAVKVIRTIDPRDKPIHGGGVEVIQYRAPDLNCTPLRVEIYALNDNGRQALSIEEVTSITRGDPPDTLFTIPEGLQERKPSEILSEFKRQYRNAEPNQEELRKWTDTVDKRYDLNRP